MLTLSLLKRHRRSPKHGRRQLDKSPKVIYLPFAKLKGRARNALMVDGADRLGWRKVFVFSRLGHGAISGCIPGSPDTRLQMG
ncbi:hypothetical protein SAMN05444165_5897 [Paraburkholderia phenazinium]|uniref:Uncharacterized protein n=1 Tax=Paraburkholderia phenazinium TaxID=60549 RepID=A0A1N6L485_9BURK|nr:hypothetical protein SAMN05444165_5897 [Paraburkholderia phenazinium]